MSTLCSLPCYDAAMSNTRGDEFRFWLRRELDKRHMAPSDLARLTGLSESIVKLWLSGKRNISKTSADRVADALGMSRNELRQIAQLPPTPDDPLAEQRERVDSFADSGLSIDEEWILIGRELSTVQRRAILELVRAFVDVRG